MNASKNRIALALFALVNLVFFFLIFGNRLYDLDGFLFSNAYDSLKNYYNYIYFSQVQSSGGLLEYHGMNYPFHDYIYYTDSTPVVSWLTKLLGIEKGALSFYHLFFLLNFLLAPILAFKIGSKLNFNPVLNFCFSIFIVWMHPMVLNLASWTNLSLSIFFLAAIYILMKLFNVEHDSKKSIVSYLSLFTLIVLASFTHLYYLPLLMFLIGPALVILFLSGERKRSLISIASLISGFIFVYVTIRLTDRIYNMRPTETLGFNSNGWTCSLSDYFKSYNFLKLPAFFEQSDWNLERLTFLGSAFPIVLIISLMTLMYSKRKKIRIEKSGGIKFLMIGIFAGSMVCYFTSIGNQLNLFVGKIEIFNFLNPLNLISKVSDNAQHFRCMSRFSLPFFTGITIVGFYLFDRTIKLISRNWLKYLILSVVILISTIDIYQMMYFTKDDFKSENYFSEENLSHIPPITVPFDAILPIPYFHVGSEKLGYIIDDTDQWSRYVYQLALKNKKPLMSSKMSRTPVVYAEKLLSLFGDSPDEELLAQLKGKTILVCESKTYKAPEMKDEPAKSIASNPKFFIEKWEPEFRANAQNVNYYILKF